MSIARSFTPALGLLRSKQVSLILLRLLEARTAGPHLAEAALTVSQAAKTDPATTLEVQARSKNPTAVAAAWALRVHRKPTRLTRSQMDMAATITLVSPHPWALKCSRQQVHTQFFSQSRKTW